MPRTVEGGISARRGRRGGGGGGGGGGGSAKRKRPSSIPPSSSIRGEEATPEVEVDVKIEDNETTAASTAASKTSKSRRTPASSSTSSSSSKRAKKPSLQKAGSSLAPLTLSCLLDGWPPYFTSLAATHRALNLVFTFCCTRKHLATTFETIRGAVEAHTKRALLVEDVAAITALRPEGINFGYVDEVMLQIDVKGAERDSSFLTGRGGRGFKNQGLAPDASVGGITGLESLGAQGCRRDDGHEGVRGQEDLLTAGGKEVLYFEFVDGDLKRQVACRKTGEPTKPTRKLREEDLKMPVYSQQQMSSLIEKRNVKFTNAVVEFINRCVESSIDPEMALKSEAEAFVPVQSSKDAADLEPKPLDSTLPDTIPKERKSIPDIVDELKNSSWYTGQIVPDGHRVFEAQEPVYGDLNFLLSQDLVNALYNAKNITQFFAHQAEAINALHDGHHVVVSTSTSSGKSLIYQLPVLHALEQDHNTRAMYIFPTKALAQDQRRSLQELLQYLPGLEETLVETFDGDTPWKERGAIRDMARIIFTNPDMLHITILPQEERWRTFLQNLKIVVVDELHYYNGLMGSHVAFIMRRLRRICAAVGNRRVKFVSCSATVANPREHFQTIFGIDNVHLVDYDGSPSGRKEFLCWNTPFRDPGDPTSGRGNAMYECARLFTQLVLRGVRVIGFCRVREQCEKLTGAVKHELERLGRSEVVNRVVGYRGGYTPQDRRRIETEMFEGKLLGIIATTALELGVDIGSLDAVLTWGFPYTISNLRQQSGRAGRRLKDSLSVLVGDCFPTDQHFMQNPDELFSRPHGELQVDLENPLVKEGHIQCAAYEMPIRPRDDAKYFGQDLATLCTERLIKDDAGFYHTHDRFRPLPSKFVSIRDTEDEHFAIIDITHGRNVVLEELEASRATFTIYDGAIFLHQGVTYLVRDFSPEKHMARVEKVKVDWTTTQRDYTDVDPIETEAIRTIKGVGGETTSPANDNDNDNGDYDDDNNNNTTTSDRNKYNKKNTSACSRAFHGTIQITQVVFGYFKVDRRNRILDAVHVDNPPVVRYSKGMWIDLPRRALEILDSRRLHVAAAIHAAEHAMMSLIPNFVLSMPGDVRTECKNSLKEFAAMRQGGTNRKRPARLTFYDAKGGAGGSGINTKAFEHVDLLLVQALSRVEGCGCWGGCPECVASEFCKHANEVMSKAGSVVVLRCLLGMEIDVDALPMGPEEGWDVDGNGGRGSGTATIETVVLATPVLPRDRASLRLVDVKMEEVEGLMGGIPGVQVGLGDGEQEGGEQGGGEQEEGGQEGEQEDHDMTDGTGQDEEGG
ncbi:P-loop containing nucleoside triphosphate hydrolase protein [Coniella lustricola]|uniref:P-loop containing nucleoside triphosphate hydrolase protein n=1 Tax=Coniella lustricola TaxID=2025994 RepID=A0A2T3A347_9PEZI|nr:P-loop containing nucleoside triphosphate hydrolase protein [Coniella lustricola]